MWDLALQLVGVLPALALNCHPALRELPYPRTLTPSRGRPHPVTGPGMGEHKRSAVPPQPSNSDRLCQLHSSPWGGYGLCWVCTAAPLPPCTLPLPSLSSSSTAAERPACGACLWVCCLGNPNCNDSWEMFLKDPIPGGADVTVWLHVGPSTFAGNLIGLKYLEATTKKLTSMNLG